MNRDSKLSFGAALGLFLCGFCGVENSLAQTSDNMADHALHARVVIAKTQIEAFKSALESFEVDTGKYPKTLDELVTAPKDLATWRGPYLSKVPLDPWDRPYVYVCPSKQKGKEFDLVSYGADGKEGGGDDITNEVKSSDY